MSLVLLESTYRSESGYRDMTETFLVDTNRIESIRKAPCYMGGVIIEVGMHSGATFSVVLASLEEANAKIAELRGA